MRYNSGDYCGGDEIYTGTFPAALCGLIHLISLLPSDTVKASVDSLKLSLKCSDLSLTNQTLYCGCSSKLPILFQLELANLTH